MADYIFKVKRISDTQAEIVDAKVWNCQNMAVTAFATYYNNESYDVKLKKTDPDRGWIQHVDHSGFLAAEHNACESLATGSAGEEYDNHSGLKLNRADGSSTLTITHTAGTGSGGIIFQAVDQVSAYGKADDGLTGQDIADAGRYLNMVAVQTTAVLKPGYWMRNSNNTAQKTQIKAIVKYGYGVGSNSNEYQYRVYCENIADSTQIITLGVGDGLDFSATGDWSTGTISGASDLNAVVDQLSITDSSYNSGTAFHTIHYFPAANLGTAVPEVTSKYGRCSMVGIRMDPPSVYPAPDSTAGGLNRRLAEAHPITAVANKAALKCDGGNNPSGCSNWSTNSTVEISVIDANGWAAGDYAVEVGGTTHNEYPNPAPLSAGWSDTSTANVDWFKFGNVPSYYLGYKQDWMWATTTSAPPAATPVLTANASGSACVITVNVTALSGYSTPLKGWLIGPNDGSPTIGEAIQNKSFSGTGSWTFDSLVSGAATIPANNPNGTYDILFSQNGAYGTALSTQILDHTVNTCPFFDFVVSQSNGTCNLVAQLSNIHGYSSLKVKVLHNDNSAVVDGNGTAFEHTFGSLTTTGHAGPVSHTFNLATAVGICDGDNLRVQVLTSGGTPITMADHGNQSYDVIAWSGESGCGEVSVTNASPTQANCQVTGYISATSCLPSNSNGQISIRGKLHKNSDNSHIQTVTVTKANQAAWDTATSGSSKVNFLFGAGSETLENITYKIIWEYQNSSDNWVDLSQNQTIAVNSCPTFSGSATASTSPKCGITITVNWSATSNLGSEIRAIVFLDANGNGTLDGGENVITGATLSGGGSLNFSGGDLAFTGSGTESKTVVLDGVSDPNAKYIVEFQADPDGDSTFSPLNSPSIGLSTADAHKAVTITNCTPCANNASPFYYFEVSGGNIVTNDGTNRGVKRCDTNAFTAFAGGYCKTDNNSSNWTIIGKASGGQWGSSDVTGCADGPGQADGTATTVRLYGSHLQTGQPLSVFTSGSSWTTPLADGWYIVCSTTFPTPDADPCGTAYAFEIDTNGKIVSTNGQSGSNLRAAAFSGTHSSRSGTHTWGTGNDICYNGESFTYEPVIHASEAVARSSLGCGGKTAGTLYLFGNAIDGLYVHSTNNASTGQRKTGAAGWYTTCVVPAAGTAVCGTERFLQITSAAGDWDGKIYDCSGSVVRTDATSADWFEESPMSGWTGSSVGNGWTGGNPTAASACNLCAGNYVNVNTGSNIIYVSGTLVNGRTNADKLRIYRGAGLTNPLAAGWYRYCGTPVAPKANGVPEFREKFNCYGNPFSWWSAKPRGTLVLDDNSYLTNGINGKMEWWRDAPVKDLTDTNNDLGIYEWWDDGPTKNATIQRTVTSRSCISNHQNGGGSTQDKDIFQFTSGKKKNLTRSPFANHPDSAQGIHIISSEKTSATEVTAAIVFDTDSTNGMILQLTDVHDSSGMTSGTWDNLEKSVKAGNVITESVLVFKKSGSSQVTLQTQKRTLSWNSSNNSASWGSWTQSAALTASVSGFAIAVIKATAEGHTIRINGAATASNSSVSVFCDGNKGITNLNTEIGGDDGKLTPTMKLAEVILYDEELNYDEMQELEGWLAERWCKQLDNLTPAHPYYADGPNCSTCESVCCEAEVTVSTTVTGASHKVEVTPSYKCSEDVWGYQFKLLGLSGLNITPGVWKEGDTITTTVSGKTFSVTFTDPFAHGFKNYLVSDKDNNIWVVGHFYDSGSGDYDKVLPPQAAATAFTVITITETSSNKVQSWGGISGTIVTSKSKLNNPHAPHPILATYYPNQTSRQETPVSTYNGDSTGDGTVSMTDVEAIISRIPKAGTPFDLEISSGVAECWMETLDANGKGWLDITDAVTTILNLKTNGTNGGSGTPISNSAVVKSTATPKNLLSVAACINRMKPTECEPCPCPDLLEPEECISRVWISNITPVDKDQQFAIITVKYQSSCCIDGYQIELGGYDPTKIGNTGYHDGVVYAPSTGYDIGQHATETHARNWLHGTTLDPTYSGDTALENGDDIWIWQAASTAGYPLYLSSPPKTKFNFPIVWGMSIATLASAAAASSKQNSDRLQKMIRMGYGCIPATCDGKSRLLTRFVVNMRTFMAAPYIKSFRLVTNDDLATPISFDTGSGITWTGDGSDSNSTVDSTDWTEALLYMGFGWSRTTSFSDSAEQTAYRNKVKVFSAENDNSYIDVVDALTVSNHLLRHGPHGTQTSSKIVPKDCCECTLPGSFRVSASVLPCNCWEEGYKKGREGEVTLTWTASSDATSYTILRFVENRKTTTPNDKTGQAGWHVDNTQTTIASRVGGQVLYNTSFGANYKNNLEHQKVGTWETVARLDNTATTWVDKNSPRYEKCCPDDVLPKVIYIVVARNDCGEVSAKTTYEPDCCGTAPIAYDVAIGNRTVNQQLTFMADAYHPMAAPPYGGVSKAATALVTFTGIPADNVTLKVIDYLGTSHTFKFKAGGGSNTTTLTFINTTSQNTVTKLGDALVAGLAAASVQITGVNSTGAVTMTQNDGDGTSAKDHTICGNTKISVSDATAITLPATGKFTEGNGLCTESTPGFPATCEDLMFKIFRVKYSRPVTGTGRFVGPGDAGQPLPRPNRNGRWLWVPPTGYIGDVTFFYRVRNESGCEDVGKITVSYLPIKVRLDCRTFPCLHPNYGQAILKFDRPKGVIGEVRILRKLSTDGSAWDTSRTSSQLVKDVNDRPVIINLTNNTQETITYVDTTAPLPAKCCSADLAYDYMLLICQINDYVVATNQQGKQTKSVLYCTESSICRVTIPCCPLPKNPIPELCVSDCDGVAATAKIVITDAGGVAHGNTFILVDSAGLSTTYTINGGVASGAGGGSSGSATVGWQGVGGGASGKIAGAAAIVAAINATSDANYSAVTDGTDTVTITQGTVGSVGNKINTDSIAGATVSSFTCGFDASSHPSVRISWAPIQSSDNAVGYLIWKRRKGEAKYKLLPHKVRALQDAANPNWHVTNGEFTFTDSELKITKYCEPAIYYQYAVTTINANGESGDPNDTDWGTWTSTSANQGDKCSPGGTTLSAALVNCPPSPCLKEEDVTICLERTHSMDLSKLTGCLPRKADGTIVPHTYSIVSSASWVSPTLSGSILSFDTYDIDFGSVGTGPHNGAIVWRVTITDSNCASTTNQDINITLVDCGCPCPDDEKDYTICDVNFDNAEYVANNTSVNPLIRKLVNAGAQIPFSLGREGGQNLRKGKPYMVSKGEIDQS